MKRSIDLSAAALHLLAMAFMLCDHLWATVVPGSEWLTCVGRLAFPIFAFLTVEGYVHTRDLKKYRLRLLLFALLSEIPYDLMVGGSAFYPFGQNVLWTFLIGLWVVEFADRESRAPGWKKYLRWALAGGLGWLLGTVTMVDYGGAGVLTVLLFFCFRGESTWCRLAQAAGMWYIHFEMLKGLGYEMRLFGFEFFLGRQSLAVLALPILWLYRGRQGHKSRVFRWICYGFYPAHMLILALLGN